MAAARFTVTKPEEEEVPITENAREGYGSYDGAHVQHVGKGEQVFFILTDGGGGGGGGYSGSKLLLPIQDMHWILF